MDPDTANYLNFADTKQLNYPYSLEEQFIYIKKKNLTGTLFLIYGSGVNYSE
jgi:hypothetical protein